MSIIWSSIHHRKFNLTWPYLKLDPNYVSWEGKFFAMDSCLRLARARVWNCDILCVTCCIYMDWILIADDRRLAYSTQNNFPLSLISMNLNLTIFAWQNLLVCILQKHDRGSIATAKYIIFTNIHQNAKFNFSKFFNSMQSECN